MGGGQVIAAIGLRWVVTIAFTGAGLFCLYQCLRRCTTVSRIGDALHVLMCGGMVAMAWPAAMGFARVPQVLLFAAGAVWFVGVLVLSNGGHVAHGGRLALGHHALMMAGMTWMVLVMPSAMTGMTAMPPGGQADMAGMSMAGPTATTMGDTPTYVVVAAVVLAVVFLVAGIGWLARAIDSGRTSGFRMRTVGFAAEVVMSLGMALMAALMI